jgi:RNA polymerase sigma-70 factor, ECF subfamily
VPWRDTSVGYDATSRSESLHRCELIRHYEPRWDWDAATRRCLREARRYLRSDADAQEVAQEALLRAWRNRSRCNNPADPGPWLVTIARNEALRKLGRSSDTLVDQLSTSEYQGAWSAELESTATRVDVERALSELSDEDRELLHLRYDQDLTQEACAERLSIPEGTVKVRLHRLRHRLRERLES